MTLDQAKVILKDYINSDGSLYNLSNFLSWRYKAPLITLDGEFDVEELEAIAVYMKNNS